jgi:hypothetical protein
MGGLLASRIAVLTTTLPVEKTYTFKNLDIMIKTAFKTIILISLLAIGCSKSEIVGKIPRTYEIHFKFTDQAGNNLLANMTEDELKGNVKVSSPDGEILASGVYVRSYNGEKLLMISVNSRPDDLLESINYSIRNPILTGSTSNELIKATWQEIKNTAAVKTVYFNSNEIVPIQYPQATALVYYPFVRP